MLSLLDKRLHKVTGKEISSSCKNMISLLCIPETPSDTLTRLPDSENAFNPDMHSGMFYLWFGVLVWWCGFGWVGDWFKKEFFKGKNALFLTLLYRKNSFLRMS